METEFYFDDLKNIFLMNSAKNGKSCSKTIKIREGRGRVNVVFNAGGEEMTNCLEQGAVWELLQSSRHGGESGM